MPIQNYLWVVLVELFWTRFVQAFSKCRWHGAELVVWDQLFELRTSLLICAPTQTGESFWWGCKCHHNLRWLVKFFQSCSSYRWQRCREGVKNLQSLKLVVHHILAPSQSTLNPLVHKLISCCGHDIVTIDIHNSLCYCLSWVVKYLQVAEYIFYAKYTKYVECRLVTAVKAWVRLRSVFGNFLVNWCPQRLIRCWKVVAKLSWI